MKRSEWKVSGVPAVVLFFVPCLIGWFVICKATLTALF